MWKTLWWNPTFYQTIINLVNSKRVVIDENGIVQSNAYSISIEMSWVRFRINAIRDCAKWLGIYFKQFQIVPTFCRERCWKVVIKIPNVYQLFRVENWMRNELSYSCKCGIDDRQYTPNKMSSYAAFFWFTDEESARAAHEDINGQVKKRFGDWPVILKRACTEMEMFCPTDKFCKETCDPHNLEERLESLFGSFSDYSNFKGVEWIDNHVKCEWIKHARKIGDTSYQKIGKVPWDELKYVTYHDEVNHGQ